MTSREFNQDTGRAKREAEKVPVIITDRGKPSHVLMSYEQYERMTKTGRSIWDALAVPGYADIELDISPLRVEPERYIDLED